ncbi:MAG: glycoside hydrolase/phage tail family protein [Pseudomonadota bacterium]
MATILLSAAGAAIGGSLGGGALGLSSAVIGRAIGATIGKTIDQRLMGSGSQTVETGKLDRMRVMGASEGGAIPRLFGRARVPGNVIWTSNYREDVTTTTQSGGKGSPKGPTTKSYSYSISIAVALCEGEISRVGRVWADGNIVQTGTLNMRVYKGSQDQLPDPLMSAIEGEDQVPAYRGLAYVVFEDIPLEPYGNRVPQFTFEVVRPAQPLEHDQPSGLVDIVRGVALLPGSGEFALATTPVYTGSDFQGTRAANINAEDGQVDLVSSIDALSSELPRCKSTSLIVSWFGDDLRAGHCRCLPKVEIGESSALGVLGSTPVPNASNGAWANQGSGAWSVSGITRPNAEVVGQLDGRPIYGGTPTDDSVIEAIQALQDAGQDVMFYPFLLMEVLADNTLPNPWTGGTGQPPLPWRGRITTDRAPGVSGSTDRTAAARAEVETFIGTAQPSDFSISNGKVYYSGPAEYSYRRFILHCAFLCAAAGGVEAFCIGSEMRALTQIRDENDAFPAVEAFRVLAAEVKAILPDADIGYAADWSEYFGYHPQDGSGDVFFHLDPLWADTSIDFIGIDNYMPLSDWRDGAEHLDASVGSIYDIDYLTENVVGGEGYDWYYRSQQDREDQVRTPITDGAYGEDWVFRYKDLAGWWTNLHFDRIAGVKVATPTDWVPQSKPFWFTELGCAAIDKGPNQPNKFLDEKSSESARPYFSNGARDDYVQIQYLRAFERHFSDVSMNPVSTVYGGAMVDVSKTHVWSWDARPWPDFPNNLSTWSDGQNYLSGHWITGRSSVQTLASVVAELCEYAGMSDYDVTRLHGIVRGYSVTELESPRASLQSLMVTFGIDAIERNGQLVFQNRDAAVIHDVTPADYVLPDDADTALEVTRAPEAELAGTVRLGFTAGEAAFESHVVSTKFPTDTSPLATQNDLPIYLTGGEAQSTVERWLAESRVSRDSLTVALPPSRMDVKAGDWIRVEDGTPLETIYRVDRVEDGGARALEATRVEKDIYAPSKRIESIPNSRSFVQTAPVIGQFMDLPLLTGNETPHAPHLAVSTSPWPGSVAVYSATEDSGYGLNTLIERPAILGVLETELPHAASELWHTGAELHVRLQGGALSARSKLQVLNGANVAAIGDGTSDNWEIIQFADAELIDQDTYVLDQLLRGRAGTDAIMPEVWPENSRFVLLDGAPEQISLEAAQRDLSRHYRVGPANKPYDDPSYRHYEEAFSGIGLRPLSPAQLRSRQNANGWDFSWIRRTRIDGDSWSSIDVPLGEETEAYQIRIVHDGALLRTEIVSAAEWTYTSTQASADGVSTDFEIQIAQLSQSYGPGPFSRKVIYV